MLKVYQISISRAEAKAINESANPMAIPKYKAHCDASVLGKFPGREFYSHVADFPTDDLDRAFEIGNIGPETGIVTHDRWHSLSVGDVLVREDGTAFIVASFGFDQITF